MILWCNVDMEGWSPSQPPSAEKRGTSWINQIAELRYGDEQQLTLTFYFWVPQMPAFELWEEAGKPEENPHRHFWNMQTIHRKFFPYFSDHLKGIALSLSCEHNCPNSFDFWGSVTCFLNRTEINVDSTSVDWIHGIQPTEYVPLRQTNRVFRNLF